MAYFREIFEQISKNVVKFNISFANISQNRRTFLIVGKYMIPILGQNSINRWVSFHFISSLPKKILSCPSPEHSSKHNISNLIIINTDLPVPGHVYTKLHSDSFLPIISTSRISMSQWVYCEYVLKWVHQNVISISYLEQFCLKIFPEWI